MKLKGVCTILCFMLLQVFDICDSKCDEYIIIFQEYLFNNTCLSKPIKMRDINWSQITYPCNSKDTYEEIHKNKDCILEFECMNSQLTCKDERVTTNHATHVFIPNNKTEKEINKIEEIERPMYDVNLIYESVNENDIQNNSESFEKTKNHKDVVQCYQAETSCDKKNQIGNNVTRHDEAKGTIELTITFDRDLNSPIQPIFTGYYPHFFNDANRALVDLNKARYSAFHPFKTVTLTCKLLEGDNCKQNVGNRSITEVIMYLKTNYIQNGTRVKYPNCTKERSIRNNSLDLKCDGREFSKHNPDIVYVPHVNNSIANNETATKFNNTTNQDVHLEDLFKWNCRIDLNYTLPSEQYNESHIINFKNCSDIINSSTINNKSRELNGTLTGNNKDRIIINLITDNRINKENFSSITQENVLTLYITENQTNCVRNSTFSIDEGKIIDLDPNNKEKFLEYNTTELRVSNCINNESSILNNTTIHQHTELAIILNRSFLNISNLKLLNGILKKEHKKDRIILHCDHGNSDGNTSTERDETVFECKSIDLDDFNKKDKIDEINNNTITNTKVNETSNKKCSVNKTSGLNECINHNTSQKRDNRTKNRTFNRRKDITEGLGQEFLALEADDTVKITLIVLSSIAGVCMVLVIVLRRYFKDEDNGPAPTREAPDDAETAL